MTSWKKWAQIVSRVTGFDTPIFGISWNPPVPQRQIAEEALTFIESRNLLDKSFEHEESPERTYIDAERIRDELTKIMKPVGRDTAVFRQLDAIRQTCSIYRRTLRDHKLEHYGFGSPIPTDAEKAQFLQALGAIRDACGKQIMILCVEYGIDVPPRLLQCLPPPELPE